MKRSVLAFAMTLMLALSLTACSNRGVNGGDPGTGANGNGTSGTATPGTTGANGTNGGAARTSARDNAYVAGDYYASEDGSVADWSGSARRAMDGVADSVKDMGRDAQDMVYDLTME